MNDRTEGPGDLRAELLARMPWEHRGPHGGDGCNPNGKRWNGIVEDTAALWVSWFVALARGRGLTPPELGLQCNGHPLHFTTRRLTFGARWYFLCPYCGRRCEALYILGKYVACRQCLHLGYRSQAHVPGSPEILWDMVLSPHGPLPRRYFGAGALREQFEAMLQARAERGIKTIMDSLAFGDR